MLDKIRRAVGLKQIVRPFKVSLSITLGKSETPVNVNINATSKDQAKKLAIEHFTNSFSVRATNVSVIKKR
jgi:hypothetical protein